MEISGEEKLELESFLQFAGESEKYNEENFVLGRSIKFSEFRKIDENKFVRSTSYSALSMNMNKNKNKNK